MEDLPILEIKISTHMTQTKLSDSAASVGGAEVLHFHTLDTHTAGPGNRKVAAEFYRS